MDCNSILCDVMIALITGIISGFITGGIVYLVTKHRERKYEVYNYCRSFLFSALEKCEMYIPDKALTYLSAINRDENSRWRISTRKILDYINPFGHEEKEFSKEENDFFENVKTALEELEEWKKRKHIY